LWANSEYGYFRDELYFIVCGQHPDWGYVDQPPLVPLLASLMHALFPNSLTTFRLIPALAHAGTVALTAETARKLGGCVYRLLDSTILMMKAAEKRLRCEGAEALGDATERGVLGQGSMSSLLIVVARVGGKDPVQMAFAQDYDVVQAFSPDRADQPLRMAIIGYVSRSALTSC
jgi:hypothetical protein